MTVIAMTREMGSQGKDVAIGLAERLGLNIVHHNLVENDLSSKMKAEESDVHRYLEGKTNLLQRWSLPGKALSDLTGTQVFELAEQGNVIIRGWGSTYLLRSVPHVLCIRVCAPLQNRVDTLMERLALTDVSHARREIEKNDQAHERMLKRMIPADWRDPLLYDLVINTERVPVDEGVALVERMLKLPSFQVTEDSVNRLKQLRIESQVRAAIFHDASLRGDAAAINIQVDQDTLRVVLEGGVRKRETRVRAMEVVSAMPGISDVVDNISLVRQR